MGKEFAASPSTTQLPWIVGDSKEVDVMLDEDNQFLESDNKKGTSKAQLSVSSDDDPSQLVRPEVRPGSFPGDERIRFI